MSTCKSCGVKIPSGTIIDGVRRNISNRRHCLACIPWGTQKGPVKGSKHKCQIAHICCVCGNERGRKSVKYCSTVCQFEHRNREFLAKWLKGEVSGGYSWGGVAPIVRKFLHEESGSKCVKCDWGIVHPITGLVPLTIHHKNGNCTDHSRENLDLICPNCHSLTENYGILNKNRSMRESRGRRQRGI